MAATLELVQEGLVELEQNLDHSENKLSNIQTLLQTARDELDALRTEAEEQDSPSSRHQMLEQVDGLEAKWKESKTQFASLKLLHQKRSVERFSSKRVELLSTSTGRNGTSTSSTVDRNAARQDLRTEAQLINQSKSVTQTMSRVASLMKGEIERVQVTQRVLEEENERMQNITKKMQDMGGTVNTASNAISLLDQQEKRDKQKVYAALAFFACVVIYIVLKRLGVLRFLSFLAPYFMLNSPDGASVESEEVRTEL